MHLINTATLLLCERQIIDWEEELAKHLKKVHREDVKLVQSSASKTEQPKEQMRKRCPCSFEDVYGEQALKRCSSTLDLRERQMKATASHSSQMENRKNSKEAEDMVQQVSI